MQLYSMYQPKSQEMVQQFLETRPFCVVITQSQPDPPVTGFYNPLVEGDQIYLHMHRMDPQLKILQKNPEATLVFSDYHGYVPSYAKSEEDASFATMFYRFAEIRAESVFVDSPSESLAILDRMMQRYQPEGGYRPLAGNPEFYESSLRMIQVIRLTRTATQTKWKLGQNRTPDEQLRSHSFMRT